MPLLAKAIYHRITPTCCPSSMFSTRSGFWAFNLAMDHPQIRHNHKLPPTSDFTAIWYWLQCYKLRYILLLRLYCLDKPEVDIGEGIWIVISLFVCTVPTVLSHNQGVLPVSQKNYIKTSYLRRGIHSCTSLGFNIICASLAPFRKVRCVNTLQVGVASVNHI